MKRMSRLSRAWYGLCFGLGVSLFVLGVRGWSAETAGDPPSGKIVYEKNCQGCHGKTGSGVGGATPSLTDKARMATKTDAALFETVTHGRPGTGMPAWGKILSERDRWDVIAYIRALAGRQ